MANKAGEVGSIAPDFVLQDQNRTAVSLSDLKGKKVVLSFHPLAWTRVCKLQMQDLKKSKERLDELGAVALGFSVDSVPCKRAWAKEIGVAATSLLAEIADRKNAGPRPEPAKSSSKPAPKPEVEAPNEDLSTTPYISQNYRFTEDELRWLRRQAYNLTERIGIRVSQNTILRVALGLLRDVCTKKPRSNPLLDAVPKLRK